MKWENRRYQLIEDTFNWEHSFTRIKFASDDLEQVKEYVINSDIKNISTFSGGKIFYILDSKEGKSIKIKQ